MIRQPPTSTRTDTLFPTRRSSDLFGLAARDAIERRLGFLDLRLRVDALARVERALDHRAADVDQFAQQREVVDLPREVACADQPGAAAGKRSEEHTSELQSLMRISYPVFCLKQKKQKIGIQ